MARDNGTRARMLEAGEYLLSERGYSNVTMLDVIERASAPRGSIYHHFPGGKEEMALEVVSKVAGEAVEMVDWVTDRTETPEEFLVLLVERHRRRLEKSDFALGCPMMGIMVNATTQTESLRIAVADGFSAWTNAIAQGLTSKGVPLQTARRVALTAVGALEGAILISRTTRSFTPFKLLTESLPALLRGEDEMRPERAGLASVQRMPRGASATRKSSRAVEASRKAV